MLREEFGARRLWLFGSLARGRFGPGSDVDLAVEGVVGSHLLRAHARVQGLFVDVLVDLLAVEDAGPALLRVIEGEGIPL